MLIIPLSRLVWAYLLFGCTARVEMDMHNKWIIQFLPPQAPLLIVKHEVSFVDYDDTTIAAPVATVAAAAAAADDDGLHVVI